MEPDNPTTKEESSFGSLFSNLSHEFSSLVRQEVELAKAEASEKTDRKSVV